MSAASPIVSPSSLPSQVWEKQDFWKPPARVSKTEPAFFGHLLLEPGRPRNSSSVYGAELFPPSVILCCQCGHAVQVRTNVPSFVYNIRSVDSFGGCKGLSTNCSLYKNFCCSSGIKEPPQFLNESSPISTEILQCQTCVDTRDILRSRNALMHPQPLGFFSKYDTKAVDLTIRAAKQLGEGKLGSPPVIKNEDADNDHPFQEQEFSAEETLQPKEGNGNWNEISHLEIPSPDILNLSQTDSDSTSVLTSTDFHDVTLDDEEMTDGTCGPANETCMEDGHAQSVETTNSLVVDNGSSILQNAQLSEEIVEASENDLHLKSRTRDQEVNTAPVVPDPRFCSAVTAILKKNKPKRTLTETDQDFKNAPEPSIACSGSMLRDIPQIHLDEADREVRNSPESGNTRNCLDSMFRSIPQVSLKKLKRKDIIRHIRRKDKSLMKRKHETKGKEKKSSSKPKDEREKKSKKSLPLLSSVDDGGTCEQNPTDHEIKRKSTCSPEHDKQEAGGLKHKTKDTALDKTSGLEIERASSAVKLKKGKVSKTPRKHLARTRGTHTKKSVQKTKHRKSSVKDTKALDSRKSESVIENPTDQKEVIQSCDSDCSADQYSTAEYQPDLLWLESFSRFYYDSSDKVEECFVQTDKASETNRVHRSDQTCPSSSCLPNSTVTSKKDKKNRSESVDNKSFTDIPRNLISNADGSAAKKSDSGHSGDFAANDGDKHDKGSPKHAEEYRKHTKKRKRRKSDGSCLEGLLCMKKKKRKTEVEAHGTDPLVKQKKKMKLEDYILVSETGPPVKQQAKKKMKLKDLVKARVKRNHKKHHKHRSATASEKFLLKKKKKHKIKGSSKLQHLKENDSVDKSLVLDGKIQENLSQDKHTKISSTSSHTISSSLEFAEPSGSNCFPKTPEQRSNENETKEESGFSECTKIQASETVQKPNVVDLPLFVAHRESEGENKEPASVVSGSEETEITSLPTTKSDQCHPATEHLFSKCSASVNKKEDSDSDTVSCTVSPKGNEGEDTTKCSDLHCPSEDRAHGVSEEEITNNRNNVGSDEGTINLNSKLTYKCDSLLPSLDLTHTSVSLEIGDKVEAINCKISGFSLDSGGSDLSKERNCRQLTATIEAKILPCQNKKKSVRFSETIQEVKYNITNASSQSLESEGRDNSGGDLGVIGSLDLPKTDIVTENGSREKEMVEIQSQFNSQLRPVLSERNSESRVKKTDLEVDNMLEKALSKRQEEKETWKLISFHWKYVKYADSLPANMISAVVNSRNDSTAISSDLREDPRIQRYLGIYEPRKWKVFEPKHSSRYKPKPSVSKEKSGSLSSNVHHSSCGSSVQKKKHEKSTAKKFNSCLDNSGRTAVADITYECADSTTTDPVEAQTVFAPNLRQNVFSEMESLHLPGLNLKLSSGITTYELDIIKKNVETEQPVCNKAPHESSSGANKHKTLLRDNFMHENAARNSTLSKNSHSVAPETSTKSLTSSARSNQLPVSESPKDNVPNKRVAPGVVQDLSYNRVPVNSVQTENKQLNSTSVPKEVRPCNGTLPAEKPEAGKCLIDYPLEKADLEDPGWEDYRKARFSTEDEQFESIRRMWNRSSEERLTRKLSVQNYRKKRLSKLLDRDGATGSRKRKAEDDLEFGIRPPSKAMKICSSTFLQDRELVANHTQYLKVLSTIKAKSLSVLAKLQEEYEKDCLNLRNSLRNGRNRTQSDFCRRLVESKKALDKKLDDDVRAAEQSYVTRYKFMRNSFLKEQDTVQNIRKEILRYDRFCGTSDETRLNSEEQKTYLFVNDLINSFKNEYASPDP